MMVTIDEEGRFESERDPGARPGTAVLQTRRSKPAKFNVRECANYLQRCGSAH